MLLFGQNLGCTSGDAAGLGKYTVIGVGNGTALGGSTSKTDVTGAVNDNQIVRITGTLGAFTNSTATGDPAIQRITAQFTWSGGTTNTINQAGLFNQTTAGADSSAFALKNFPSPVAMNPKDQLTVNWDITIDGTNAYGP